MTAEKTRKILLDDNNFYSLVQQFDRINQLYTQGALKHIQYVSEYDKLLENYGLTMSQFIVEIQHRRASTRQHFT